ncbi:MAG: hypothetical protein SOS98_06100 [Varibaculum sp.]|nr:hypothetical protein [Varibaculum sp.]
MSNELIAEASNPATPLKRLQFLAQNHPETRAAIAANPSTYPALLEWLGKFHNPDIDAALAQREDTAVKVVASATKIPVADTEPKPEPQPKPETDTEPEPQPKPEPKPETNSGENDFEIETIPARGATHIPVSASSETDTDSMPFEELGDADDEAKQPTQAGVIAAGTSKAKQLLDSLHTTAERRREQLHASRNSPKNNSDEPKRHHFGAWLLTGIAIVALLLTTLLVGLIGNVGPLAPNGIWGKHLYPYLNEQTIGGDQQNSDGKSGGKNPNNQNANPSGAPDAADDGNSAITEGSDLQMDTESRQVIEAPTLAPRDGKPMPKDAHTDVPRFAVADNNIICAISTGGVQCGIAEPDPELDLGNNGSPIVVNLTEGGSLEVLTLKGKINTRNTPTLTADDAVGSGDFACQSSGDGVNCWSVSTGHGFIMHSNQLEHY